MELWRLRAREFLSARSTLDNCKGERVQSLAEALSSPNSAPINWRQDRGNNTVREEMECWGAITQTSFGLSLSPVRPPEKPWAWQPGSDQVWRLSAPQRFRRRGVQRWAPDCRTRACPAGRERKLCGDGGGETQSKSAADALWHVLSNPEVKTGTGALTEVISRTA